MTIIAGNAVRLRTHAAATPAAAKKPNSLIGRIAAPNESPTKPATVVKLVSVTGNHVALIAAAAATRASHCGLSLRPRR
jgi:hypothetical protein